MNGILSLILVLLMALPAFVVCDESHVTISPANPKIGALITLIYNARSKAAALRNVTAMNGEIMLVPSKGTPVVLSTPLIREGTRWTGSFKLAGDNVVYFLVRFTSGTLTDDNGANVWDVIVCGTDGRPLRDAHLQRAYVLSGRGIFDFKRTRDPVAAKAEVAEEEKLYPDNLKAVTYRWGMMMRDSPGDTTTDKIKRELESLYGSRKDDEAIVEALLPWFEQTGQQERAGEIRGAAIAANPKGLIAASTAQQNIRAERDPKKRILLIEKQNMDFPATGDEQEARVGLMSSTLVSAGEYEKAASLLISMRNPSANSFNSLSWTMLQKGGDPGKAVDYAKAGIDILRKPGNQGKPSSMTDAQWENQKTDNLAMILDTYGFGLSKINRLEDAATAFEESYKLTHGEEHEINVHLIECVSSLGRTARVLELTRDEIIGGNATDAVLAFYKSAYVKKNGSEKGLEASLASLRGESARKIREGLMKDRVNKPSIDFSLKGLDGKTVRLSSLKGKVVVIDFWATWCGPCKYSFPFLQRVCNKYKGNDRVVFLALDTWERVAGKEREDLVRKFIADNKYTFPVLFDEGLVDQYNVEGIPTKFVIDRTGKIQFKKIGSEGEEMLENLSAQIDLLLSEDFYSLK